MNTCISFIYLYHPTGEDKGVFGELECSSTKVVPLQLNECPINESRFDCYEGNAAPPDAALLSRYIIINHPNANRTNI